MVKMEKDVNTRKRKKSTDDNIRNSKKSPWTRSGSGSEEDDEELFSWEEYLQKCHAKAAPKENFKHVQDTKVQGFVPGMKLECLDRSSLEADTYWVATIVMASGPLLLLRYDGYDDDRSGDFWCDAASEELQPIGWAAKTNNILIPPAAIRHKESNWAKFLMQDLKNAVYAPEHLFHKRSDTEDENQLKPGMKLEVLNKDDPVTYWVASVVDAYGLRLRLRHEGSEDEADDMWLYFLSEFIHQLGWGKKNNFTLGVPSGVKARYPDKDWPQITHGLSVLCQSSTEDILLNESLQKTNSLPKQHGFTTGMKLEAVNPKDPSSICPATVTKVANDAFFQVEIDSLINCGDGSKPSMWCSTNSQNIFPAGWCEKNNILLTPPPGYLVHSFKWQAYLEWTNSSAAPKTLFMLDVPPHSFEIGMKLEAVDQTNPSTITVASVTQVVGRTVWVLLDGYKHDSVEHIYDMGSYDLFPVGWCSMNGHPLLTPRVQRPPEENRRLSSLRTRTRETKKAAVVSDTTNTASSANNVSTANKTMMVNTASKTTAVSTANKTSPQNTENKSTAGNTGSVTPTVNTTHAAKTATKVANTTNKTGVTNKTITLTTSIIEKTALTANSTRITKETDTVNTSKTGDIATNGQQEGTKEVAVSEVKTEVAAPSKGPYSLRASTLVHRDYASQLDAPEEETGKDKKNVEAVIDLTGEEEGDEDYMEKDTTKPVTTSASSKSSKKDSGVCIYVRKTCETGPFLKQSRVAVMPPVIGPAGANSVLRQLVEQIVLSAHSSKQVLKLLASETDKMTISSILKTLQTKLSLCENLLSLHKVSLCSQCDAAKHPPLSPTQSVPKNSAPQTASCPKENSARTVPLRTIGHRDIGMTGPREIGATGLRVNSHPTVSSKSVISPVRRKTLSQVNSEPAASPASNYDESIAQSPVSAGLLKIQAELHSERADPRIKTLTKGLADDTGLNTQTAVNSSAQTTKHISQWNVDEVTDYIRTTDCHRFAEEFQKQEIDGRALTLLSLDEIHKCLGVTLGPAIKLHFSVQKLRNQIR